MKKLFTGILILSLFIAACNTDQQTGKQKETATISESDRYMKRGQTVVAHLSSILLNRLTLRYKQSESVPKTVEYCKIVAYPLIDTTGAQMAISARRVSEKVRNLKDEPTQLEREVLRQYKTQQLSGNTLVPTIQEIDKNTIGYFQPILVGEFCLKCHGIVGEDISQEDYYTIKDLYPNDRAIGYREGDLRGMWSIYLAK